jgi:hypothetical protein
VGLASFDAIAGARRCASTNGMRFAASGLRSARIPTASGRSARRIDGRTAGAHLDTRTGTGEAPALLTLGRGQDRDARLDLVT